MTTLLRGNLQSLSLQDVIQLLNVNKKTGKLHIVHGKHTGSLYVLNGEVVHAETPQTAGESAAFDVLEWEKGVFEFVATSFKAPTSIRRSLQDLFMEAAHSSDSRRRLRSIFPNMRAIPWPKMGDPLLTNGLNVSAEDRKVFALLDGYRNFLDLMEVTAMREEAVLHACNILAEAGRLNVIEPEINFSVAPLKSGFFKRADHVELYKGIEAQWRKHGPYLARPIANVRIIWPEGSAIARVQFVDGMEDRVVGIPKELMGSWGFTEGLSVSLRPAP